MRAMAEAQQPMAQRSWWREPRPYATILACQLVQTFFAFMAVTQCNFMIESIDNKLQVGLFSRTLYDDANGNKLGCVTYTDHNAFDGMLRGGRAFGVMTAGQSLFTLVVTVWIVFFLPSWSRKLWKVKQYTHMATTLTSMFIFFALGSHYLCTMGACRLTGVGVLSAFNVVVNAIMSVFTYLQPCPIVPWFIVWREHSESVQSKKAKINNKFGADPEIAQFLQLKSSSRNAQSNCDVGFPEQKERIPDASSGSTGHTHASEFSLGSKLGLTNSLHNFRIVILSMFLCSWCLSIAGVQRCTFMLVGPHNGTNSEFTGFGLYTRAIYNQGHLIGCIHYPANTQQALDQPFQTGRVFGAVSAFLMTFILLLHIIQIFIKYANDEIWLVIRLLLPCATVSQLLTFIIYKTETCHMQNNLVDCKPGTLGIWVILNVFLMVALSVFVNLMPPPATPLLRRCPDQPSHDDSKTAPALPPLPEVFRPRNVVKAGGLNKVNQTNTPVSYHRGQGDHALATSTCMDGQAPYAERIVQIEPLPRSPDGSYAEQAEMITVVVEYNQNEKITRKTMTHPDGSQTITTTIEELGSEEDDEQTELELCNTMDVVDEEIEQLTRNYNELEPKRKRISSKTKSRVPARVPPSPQPVHTTDASHRSPRSRGHGQESRGGDRFEDIKEKLAYPLASDDENADRSEFKLPVEKSRILSRRALKRPETQAMKKVGQEIAIVMDEID